MEREGRPHLASHLASFREHATHDDEMGMYWLTTGRTFLCRNRLFRCIPSSWLPLMQGEASTTEMDEMKDGC